MNKMGETLTGEPVIVADSKPPRRWFRLALMLIAPLALLAVGGDYWTISDRSVSTDNASVKQDIVAISAQVSGPVAEVFVKEGDTVQPGQLLFRIDPSPFRVALLQAQAQLAAAQLDERKLESAAAGPGGDITGAEASLSIAQRGLARQSQLLAKGFTTRPNYDDALAQVTVARTQLADARARAANARSAIVASGEQPGEAAALAAIARARLDLQHTEVRAPSGGIVSSAERLLRGQSVVPGIAMLSIVRGQGAWIEANFKEKDLARMAVGQRVAIELDAYPDQELKGRVSSIGAGTGSEFAILPAQNANGNWVKVTQRVPVRIAFDTKPSRPLIAGLSATVTVDLQD
jgi:membrane fusion protein (multidrug efflux system)